MLTSIDPLSVLSIIDEAAFDDPSETVESPQVATGGGSRPHTRATRKKDKLEDGARYNKTLKSATEPLDPKIVYVDYAGISKAQVLIMNSDIAENLANYEQRLWDYELDGPFLIPQLAGDKLTFLKHAPMVNLLQHHDQYSCSLVARWCSLLDRGTRELETITEMQWSGTLLFNSCDTDLARLVKERLSSFPSKIRKYGPLVFQAVAEIIYTVDEGVLSNMTEAARNLRLTDFEGENVTKALQVLRACRDRLLTLKRPLPDFATILLTLFRGCSHQMFQLKYEMMLVNNDDHMHDADWLFQDGDKNYLRYIRTVNWIKSTTTKKPSAFLADDRMATPIVGLQTQNPSPGPQRTPQAKPRKTHDARGRLIDYTPPKAGQGTTRITDGETEHWCSKCTRWGSHDDAGHENFWAEFRQNRNKKRQDDAPAAAPGKVPPAGSATVAFDPPKKANFADVLRNTGSSGPF